jgi:hypothetical protein
VSWHVAERMPLNLLAATQAPAPLPQIRMARSAFAKHGGSAGESDSPQHRVEAA